MPTWLLIPILVLCALVAVLAVLLLRSRTLWSRRSRTRLRRAAEGERHARTLLRRRGYTVVGEQVPGTWRITVDGEPFDLDVRADFVVRRAGRLLVAEVKTGDLAPDPAHPTTRRQLLEYWLAFDTDGVLLVDADSDEVMEVGFPAIVDD